MVYFGSFDYEIKNKTNETGDLLFNFEISFWLRKPVNHVHWLKLKLALSRFVLLNVHIIISKMVMMMYIQYDLDSEFLYKDVGPFINVSMAGSRPINSKYYNGIDPKYVHCEFTLKDFDHKIEYYGSKTTHNKGYTIVI